MTKTWLITGAGRGMGVEFARAALAAGHNVVATGRNPDTVRSAVGAHENLLVTALDVTDPHSAEDAAAAAIDRFGRIDVLLNNAGSFVAGFFEELTTEQVRSQIETNLFGPMTVTRAVLPVMRRQRSGLVISISSGAGVIGSPSGSAYAASKFALEGWMEIADRRGAAVRDPHDDRGARASSAPSCSRPSRPRSASCRSTTTTRPEPTATRSGLR